MAKFINRKNRIILNSWNIWDESKYIAINSSSITLLAVFEVLIEFIILGCTSTEYALIFTMTIAVVGAAINWYYMTYWVHGIHLQSNSNAQYDKTDNPLLTNIIEHENCKYLPFSSMHLRLFGTIFLCFYV